MDTDGQNKGFDPKKRDFNSILYNCICQCNYSVDINYMIFLPKPLVFLQWAVYNQINNIPTEKNGEVFLWKKEL